MKPRILELALLLAAVLLSAGTLLEGQSGAQGTRATGSSISTLFKPKLSGKSLHPRGGLIGFLMSPRGRGILRASRSPLAKALRQRLGEDEEPQTSAALESLAPVVQDLQGEANEPRVDSSAAASTGCGQTSGTRFNLEPRTPPGALPQNGTAIDFLPGAGLGGADLVVGGANDFRGSFNGLGNSLTGYYVHRNGADANPCAPDFEGGLPQITDPGTGEALFGGGDPAVEADPARSAFFMADSRLGSEVSSIGVFRTTAAKLNSPTACPEGTHNAANAQTCWPNRIEVNPVQGGDVDTLPSLAVDERKIGSGRGAGDIYIAATIATPLNDSFIFLTTCRNDLSACSPARIVSGADKRADASHVRIRPDIATNPAGSITISYENVIFNQQTGLQTYDLKYVTCTPQDAPKSPTCSSPALIKSEHQPIPSKGGGLGNGSLAAAQFAIGTFVSHDHRQDANGVETYVVWDRCKVPLIQGGDVCPDADIVLAASNDNGKTWRFGNVDTAPGDQYMPWIRTDASTNIVNIAYYSTEGDSLHHRPRVLLRQILPGPSTPDPVTSPQILTTVPMEPAGDFFLGDSFIGSYIGVAARGTPAGSRAYVHYMHNIVNGIYNGVPAPEQNNHVSRVDY